MFRNQNISTLCIWDICFAIRVLPTFGELPFRQWPDAAWHQGTARTKADLALGLRVRSLHIWRDYAPLCEHWWPKMNKVVMYGIRNYSTVNSKFTHHGHNKNTHHSSTTCQPRSKPSQCHINSSLPGQNDRHFADDVFRWHFREWKVLYFD